jgi:DNA adenine methylase
MLNTSSVVKSETQGLAYKRPQKIFPEFEYQKPFLKWAGGKTQLLPHIMKFVPTNFNQYIEPFIGGGAVYFNLNHSYSIISDLNEELIITYKQVKENVQEVIDILQKYNNTEECYYQTRALNTNKLSDAERAARLIYLNKTCFNGLFRVNKQGLFNVPYGKRSGAFLNKENLVGASNFLQKTEIYHSDYKKILLKFAQKGDFVFLDPPYQPVGKFSDFKRYTKEFFYENDQIELAAHFKELVNRGCYVILTNSNHPFILDLYKDFQIEIIETKRLISSDPKTRTGIDIIVLGGL